MKTICDGVSGKRRMVVRVAGVIAVCFATFAVPYATSAYASSVWWQLQSTAQPANVPVNSGGKIVLIATNMGDKTATAATITDKLPHGLTATAIRGSAGPIAKFSENGTVECTLSKLSCVFSGELPPYVPLWVEISVSDTGGVPAEEVNEATINGGGSVPASVRHSVTVSAALPKFGLEDFEMRPEEDGGLPATQAGSHPFQLTTTIAYNKTPTPPFQPEVPKDLNFKLPPGLIGNPTPFPQCSDADFSAIRSGGSNICPQDTAIGVADVLIDEPGIFGMAILTVPLFNLTPAQGEPARFGFDVQSTPVILDTSVRTGGDYGVTVSVDNIPQAVSFLGSTVTFWGVPGDPRHDISRGWDCADQEVREAPDGGPCVPSNEVHAQPLLTLPTSCTGPMVTTVDADSWGNVGNFQSYSPGVALEALDGCNRLGFEPSIEVAPDGNAGSSPSGLTVAVHVPQEASLNSGGLAESTVKDTTVVLPDGVGLNPAAADGLESCSDVGEPGRPEGEIGLNSPSPATCPDASKVATVSIRTPLLPNPLEGAAYLAAQNANPFGSLVALYIVAEDPVSGVLVKLAGEVVPDPVTGQLVSTFENTPQLPFEDLTLHFFGGDRAPLSTPASCGSYTTTASFAPWSGNEPSQASSKFDIVSGPNGSPCASPLPFAPTLAAGMTSIQAGGLSPFTMTMSREDGQQDLQGVQLHMPPGLLGVVSSVKLCGEVQADAGTCSAESLIGHTIVSVGLGGDPYSVTGGEVFLTGPYEGAPYGLSIVNPAKAGPFDLGKVIVRARIEVDPHTAALTVTTDGSGPYAIPHILDGIPLQIKHVNVTIDRPGFTFNPTNCSPLTVGASLSSDQGATKDVGVPFQVTNCATLAFKPTFKVTTQGKTSKANGASLAVKLTYPKTPQGSEANIARVKVDLPKQLPSRLTTLQKACTNAQFEANPSGCPAASVIGHAKAITPILSVPLEGPAYFVSHGGEAFPSLIVVLQGSGVTVDLVGTTFISKTGITSSTFKTVPDVPVGSFELTLPQGKYSALAANGNLCKAKLAMPTEFLAQNGAKITESTKIAVTGCEKKKALTRSQQLTKTLKVCREKRKGRRATCEKQARRKYGIRGKARAKRR